MLQRLITPIAAQRVCPTIFGTITNLVNLREFTSKIDDISISSHADDINKEMEELFGMKTRSDMAQGLTNAISSSATDIHSLAPPPSARIRPSTTLGGETPKLTHIDSEGKASMVDVSAVRSLFHSEKNLNNSLRILCLHTYPKTTNHYSLQKSATKRVATASARILLGPHVFSLVSENKIKKGDVLTVAQLAGIMGCKQTSNLIPLCHPLALSSVNVDLSLNKKEYAVDVLATATTVGPTGVEMEALTGASIAALTVYDMCKAASKEIEITGLKLLSKSGGKSGDWLMEK